MRFIVLFTILVISGCTTGNKPWEEYTNELIGGKAPFLDPTRFGDAGELIRADYVISGDGFTHISKNNEGQILQHWFYSEVLSTAPSEEWVGKCKIFYIVNPDTNVIISWDYDEGSNKESCRVYH
ncbi:hypothetical protein I6E85_19000 [Pseudoalteromonas sp. NZS71]|uniref:hypothetical protein n=1 Tax=unclassified Pseudoalteromonas TaxID=194690 RepID=UPI000C33917F|nr:MULTISPECIES: hypothetical protein [unclassified Pseudoalteromonas]MBH0063215.1 hypothetical protein [Pseudoalteromonas sp. NZS71]PKH92785.1 hypothetical protein CXF76_04685 [Pseudoalteromonas sp. 78C3]